MENGEENKNAETQSATENTSTNNVVNNEETNDKNSNSEGDIAKAFGNKEESNTEADNKDKKDAGTENKTEKKGGSKANSVAIQNEDGSITFKNQEELNGFISKMYAKGASKVEGNNQGVQTEEESEEQSEDQDQGQDNSAEKEESNNLQQSRDYTDSIALALVEADINPKRARAASRLIDTDKVIINGVLDNAKLEEEINNLVAEWPELKNSNQAVNQAKGFKFGGEGQQDENTEEDQLAQIFGNNNN